MMYISDEPLHAMELCINHGIIVEVEGLDGQQISEMCRFRGRQSWRGGDRRDHWVWVKHSLGRCDGALYGCLPRQLQ